MTSSVVQRLLADTTYHIEFNGYLTNHAKHAVIALSRLQAPDSKIQEYYDEYTALTPYNLQLTPAASLLSDPREQPVSITTANWSDYIGRKKHFCSLRQFFARQLEQNSTAAVLKRYAPALLPGMAGALTHGTIHLGWALDVNHSLMTAEGLAYMTYTHLPLQVDQLQSSALHASTGVASLHAFVEAAAASDLTAWVEETKAKDIYNPDAGFHPELAETGFQLQLAKVLAEGHPLLWQLPSWLDDLPLDKVLEELYSTTVSLYLVKASEESKDDHADISRSGSFLLLHLITALWGLEHIAQHLDIHSQRQAYKYFWALGVSLVATSGQIPSKAGFEAIQPQLLVQDNAFRHEEDSLWGPTVASAIDEVEEHNIKLVYVCRALWRRYSQQQIYRQAAETFTATPNIGPKSSSFQPSKRK
eukprot:m.8981 g.8981  ORF g.8981 m.8981 type:complete len:418 (+) comp9334_c0_seq2:294-1547(+)